MALILCELKAKGYTFNHYKLGLPKQERLAKYVTWTASK